MLHIGAGKRWLSPHMVLRTPHQLSLPLKLTKAQGSFLIKNELIAASWQDFDSSACPLHQAGNQLNKVH